MTKQEKRLLFIELCTRLPYEVKIKTSMGVGILHSIDYIPDGAYLGVSINGAVKEYFEYQDTKPYLRPMSSMTEEEKEEYEMLQVYPGFKTNHTDLTDMYDWLNAHHFDYRGLIPMGLALEAPNDMYEN